MLIDCVGSRKFEVIPEAEGVKLQIWITQNGVLRVLARPVMTCENAVLLRDELTRVLEELGWPEEA